jgi:L-2-hydroxyglutarate oxidase LhgO
VPPLRLAKGSYFSLAGGEAPFSRLIYPLPGGGGLGVHLTIDLGGQAKFGPDVEWLGADVTPDAVDYGVDASRAARFYPAVREWWPGLPDGALRPDYAGVRPKLSGPGEAAADFVIQGARGGHGIPGVVNLFGIESPGLTAALVIAARVVRLLRDG